MNIVGYLVHGAHSGFHGAAYDYILAGNGIFVQARSDLLVAKVQVAKANVRGLPPLTPELTLLRGKVPQRLFALALSVMLASPSVERYVGIVWNQGYQLYVPEQIGLSARVDYRTADNTVVEMHSHAGMSAFFSTTDDQDEQGLRLYGVVGDLDDEIPCLRFRLGVYGYFMPVAWADIFDGSLNLAAEVFSTR